MDYFRCLAGYSSVEDGNGFKGEKLCLVYLMLVGMRYFVPVVSPANWLLPL